VGFGIYNIGAKQIPVFVQALQPDLGMEKIDAFTNFCTLQQSCKAERLRQEFFSPE
jgi:hypothetical protein